MNHLQTAKAKKVFIQTFGCQMNDRDSENILGLLQKHDYTATATPEDADLILVNTCSIREHASHKAASQIGRFGKVKRLSTKNPLLGVIGCVAQQEGEGFLQRFPFIDLVLGPDTYPKLPQLLRGFEAQAPVSNRVDISRDTEQPVFLHEFVSVPQTAREKKGSAYVVITKGCDFKCTFCVVPNTRGPERHATPEEILEEIRGHVARGAREITLLGQNVNSYGKNFSPPYPFARLLRAIEADIPMASTLRRIRFTTSHPVDLSTDLMQAFHDLPRLCRHLHLPVQSGDDRILKRMKRLYTIADYRRSLANLRQWVPDISLSTDIIVGFPGETREDFERTLAFIREVGYTSIYAFKYSPRPYTPAANMQDDVSEPEKDERLAILLEAQREITLEKNTSLVGKDVEVLVEGINEQQAPGGTMHKLTGRMFDQRLVHFTLPEGQTPEAWIGQLCQVKIEKALPNSMRGILERDGKKGKHD